MDAKTASRLAWRDNPTRRHNCSLPDNECSDVDNSADIERIEYETVRLISAAETEVQNQEIPGRRARSLRTDWVHERRRTAPYFSKQNQRLKSMNVGGGATTNRTAESRFAPSSGRLAASWAPI